MSDVIRNHLNRKIAVVIWPLGGILAVGSVSIGVLPGMDAPFWLGLAALMLLCAS